MGYRAGGLWGFKVCLVGGGLFSDDAILGLILESLAFGNSHVGTENHRYGVRALRSEECRVRGFQSPVV